MLGLALKEQQSLNLFSMIASANVTVMKTANGIIRGEVIIIKFVPITLFTVIICQLI